jgi:hypothetical protein
VALRNSRLGRASGYLVLPVAIAFVLMIRGGTRLSWLPEPVAVVAGDRTDVYTWESLLGMVALCISSLLMALTTSVDPNSPPAAQMFQRYARNVGWIFGVGGWLIVIRLFFLLRSGRP